MATALIGLAAAAGGVLWVPSDTRQSRATNAEAAVPVVVGPVITRDLPIWRAGLGTMRPLNAVNVKVRIEGQLTRVAFTEGQDVHSGDLLAQIDPRPYAAQLKQAKASRMKDLSQLESARIDLTRASRLAEIGAGPTQTVDTLKAQVASLEAAVEADQALVDTAQLNLSFTTITSPIDGRVGLRQVDPGSIVHASDANGLVTVTQIQPITVVFSLSQDDLPEIMRGQARAPLAVVVEKRDGSEHRAEGQLVFIDSQVQPASGQILLKAVFPNADRGLWPGEFVSARLLLRTDRDATVVPSRAVRRGQDGSFLFVLRSDGSVELRPVKTGPEVDGYTAVLSGTSPGETVVLDGQSRLSTGTRVNARRTTEPSP